MDAWNFTLIFFGCLVSFSSWSSSVQLKKLPSFSLVKNNVDLQFPELRAGLPTGNGKISKETLGLIMTSQALLLMASCRAPTFQNGSETNRVHWPCLLESKYWCSGFLASYNCFLFNLDPCCCRIFAHEVIDLNIQHQFEDLGILLCQGDKLSPEELDRMMKAADADGDGMIEYKEPRVIYVC